MAKSNKRKARRNRRRSQRNAAPVEAVTPDALIARIRETPPPTPEEISRLIRGSDREALRSRVLQALSDDQPPIAFELLLHALKELGLAACWDEIAAKVADSDGDLRLRSRLLGLLREHDPERAGAFVRELGPQRAAELQRRGMQEMLQLIELEPDAAVALTELLLALPRGGQTEFVEAVESVRADTGTPAALVWAPTLSHRGLADLRPPLLKRLVDQGGAAAEELLEDLLRGSPGKKARRQLQRALMTLRSDRIGPDRKRAAARGRTWMSSCDGMGAYVAFAAVPAPGGGIRIANVCARTGGDVRDALLIPDTTQRELDRMMRTMTRESDIDFCEVPSARAADEVMEAVRTTRAQGRPVPREFQGAIAVFERLEGGSAEEQKAGPSDDLGAGASDARATLVDYRRLLEEPRHQHWFLDAQDMARAGIEPPPPELTTGRWLQHAVEQLAGSDLADRVVAMLRYTSHWYEAKGDAVRTRVVDDALEECWLEIRSSPFAQALLERSAHIARADHPGGVIRGESRFGDLARRNTLRDTLHANVDHPLGRHLAELDFAEVASHSLEFLAKALPDARQPTLGQVDELAAIVGRTMATALIDVEFGGEFDAELRRARSAISENLMTRLRLTDQEAEPLLLALMTSLYDFHGEICLACPVFCLEQPRRRMDDEYESEVHPAHLEEDD